MRISINELEYKWAAYAGILRNNAATEAGLKHVYRPTMDGESMHMLGAVGEFVASLALGVPWRGPGSFRGDDLVGGYQVRATSNEKGCLIIRSRDSDNDIFILVVGGPLKWSVPGWILGKDGKQREFRIDPTGKGRPSAYFVPQLALKPIKYLKEIH